MSQVVFDLILNRTRANLEPGTRIILEARLLTVLRVKRKSKNLPTSATKCSVYKGTFEAYTKTSILNEKSVENLLPCRQKIICYNTIRKVCKNH
tara:strand:- start:21 stop:302 length:282 start_codon:yes stop_codon:yes gene_type:complete